MRGPRPLTIRQQYFRWLYDQAFEIYDANSPLSYAFLCDILHGIPFKDTVPNDDNRTADGEELRDEFISLHPSIGLGDYAEMGSLGKASLFEVLVALSRRAQFISGERTSIEWFRQFIENLNLLKYSDTRYVAKDAFRIGKILNRWNNRKFDPDGRGGIFPLRHTMADQRQVEIWYQMAAYMTENTMD